MIRLISLTALAAALLALLWWKRPRREFVGRWIDDDEYAAWRFV